MNKIAKTGLAMMMAATMILGATACAPDTGTESTTTAATTTTAGTTTTGGTTTADETTTAAATPELSGKIVASGSTSMEELMGALGEAFSAVNPDVSVEVQGGGSSTGIKNASEGVTEIGNASRALKAEEGSLGLNEHIVAIDGIAVVVNADNPVAALTSEQIAQIFTKGITNWSDVGGDDAPIVVVLRESGSGTRDGFETLLDIVDKCVGDQEVNETGIVKSTVAGNVNAIGYMSLGKVDETITALDVDGIKATEENVKNESYVLQRPFLCLTKGEESQLAKAFFEFIYSEDGQALVTTKGFVSVD